MLLSAGRRNRWILCVCECERAEVAYFIWKYILAYLLSPSLKCNFSYRQSFLLLPLIYLLLHHLSLPISLIFFQPTDIKFSFFFVFMFTYLVEFFFFNIIAEWGKFQSLNFYVVKESYSFSRESAIERIWG